MNSLYVEDDTKRSTWWRTYTLAQNKQISTCLQNVLDKLEPEQQEMAKKILQRLSTQTHDKQLVAFTLEEDEMLDSVEQGLWRR